MASDALATPLGLRSKARTKPKGRFLRRMMLMLLGAGLAGFIAQAAMEATRRAGFMVAVVPIERPAAPVAPVPAAPAAEAKPERPAPERERATAEQVETESGVRVVRQHGGQAPDAAVIRVPDSDRSEANRQPLTPAPDPRVTERSPLGLLPKIGADGLTPRQLYARPFAPGGKPRIAVVLTGVGVSARLTADAIARLPGDFTLAFAPYGRDLEAQVMRARRDGHEILLQVPMEPFDFPDSDPGPHTLRASGAAKENIERLGWLMSRFSGYIGLMNYTGGKLLSTPQALQPVFDEINRRGLLFLDDGSAARSVSGDIGARLNLPVLRADRTMAPTGEARPLTSLLQEAETIARKQGRAIVTVPALAANIETLAAWEAELASRNITLAPLSAVTDLRANP